MSQATFDPAAPGGPSDDSGETRATRTQNAGARRRPTRRGHAANAKTTESGAQPTTPAQPAAVAPTPTAVESEVPSAPAQPTPAAEEQPARGEGRGRRSRGGAKRPAARGKAGAQLIITKTGEEAAAAPTETPVAEASVTEAPAAEVAPEAVAEPVTEPVTEAMAEPVTVPVVTAAAEPTPAPAPRKTRFGLPRRFRQPEAAPAPAAVAAPEQPAPVAQIVAEPAAAPEQPAPSVAEPTPAEPSRRYRFDRSRSTTIPGAAVTRPERLSVQRPGLYTEAAPEAAPEVTPEAQLEPAPEAAAESLFELPSLESLVGGKQAAELPTLAFGEPKAVGAEEGEQPGEAAEAEGAEGAEGAGGRRRRRRRRGAAAHNGAHGAELEEPAEEEISPTPEGEALEGEGVYGEEEPTEPYHQEPRAPRGGYAEPTGPRGRAGRFGYPGRVTRRAPVEPAWETGAQPPAAEPSPYGSPAPSFARGFGPTPSGVATPARETYPRPSRVERGAETTGASVAQLGAVIQQAISTQTDRLLNELRRQQPPAVTLAIPNAASAERVAVFVDVANVVYSARSLRTSVDFGHLLDFLRANRRLTRAQAYAPTNPEPGAEQAFLSAVKGLGYRITTKNYKTFSNGAKKADLDLDLCMDIVRLVEAKAVDTIVLVSGDSDFLPLLDYCSDHGVRVEVAAFDDAASMILRQSCDLFVNLSLVEGIRG